MIQFLKTKVWKSAQRILIESVEFIDKERGTRMKLTPPCNMDVRNLDRVKEGTYETSEIMGEFNTLLNNGWSLEQ